VILVGLVSTMVYSVFLLHKPNQMLGLYITFVGSMSSFVVCSLTVQIGELWNLLMIGAVFGFFSLNVIPIVSDQ